MNNYSYPIFPDWSKDELITMMDLYNSVEKVYEDHNGVSAQKILTLYNEFRKINPSKMEQKQIDRDFQKISNYSIYRTWVAAKNAKTKNVRMN